MRKPGASLSSDRARSSGLWVKDLTDALRAYRMKKQVARMRDGGRVRVLRLDHQLEVGRSWA
jgi:hypothetical protein